jgi:hypothetical protein
MCYICLIKVWNVSKKLYGIIVVKLIILGVQLSKYAFIGKYYFFQ